jgi:hypothetical protein
VKERGELHVAAEGRAGDGPREKWTLDLKVVKATIKFLDQTEKLNFRQQAVEA